MNKRDIMRGAIVFVVVSLIIFLIYTFTQKSDVRGEEIEVKKAGDTIKVKLDAKDGYGERNDSLCQPVPSAQFESTEGLEIGMQFEVETEQGELVVSVTKIEGEDVTVDGNHPLAGVELHFDVTIKSIRDASAEELAHGHVHGEGGHHH